MIVLLTNAYIFFSYDTKCVPALQGHLGPCGFTLSSCTIQKLQAVQVVKRVVSPKRHFGHLTGYKEFS